ncbi:transposase family protein [Spiroplasma poulsonii]|uniref:transposase family protein n=1 Tax=Spiroplasma poulsonii TaxID=2138 RepID=UPI001F4C837D|nr:transposase family protein [Spiroplasma poulsonii]UNF61896.1 transposase family protein [Spiroplasma poulsonii]
MTLLYWREYQTYFLILVKVLISEANCYRVILRIEDILIKTLIFNNLLKSTNKWLFNDKLLLILKLQSNAQKDKTILFW